MGYIGAGITRFNTADELTVTGDAQIDTTTLVVDSTNNRVGIGTASPTTALDVTGAGTFVNLISSSNAAYMRFQNSAATGGYVGYVDDDLSLWGNASYKGFLLDGATNDISFYDNTGTTQGLFWDASTQRLGLGTTSPSFALEVNAANGGGLSVVGASDTNSGWRLKPLGNDLYISQNGISDNVVFKDGGNVGIGTDSPDGLVHAYSGDSGQAANSNANQLIAENSGNAGISIMSGASSLGNIYFSDSGSVNNGYIRYDHSTDQLKLKGESDIIFLGQASSEKMRIDSGTGSVNIGGTGAQAKFEVNNAVSTTGSLTDTTINLATTGVTGRKANIGFGLAGGVANTNAATIGFDVTSGSGALKGDLFFSTRGSTADSVPTERVRIDSSGNVGIGETAPANLLHVKASDTGIAPHASAQIVLEREGTNYLQFLTAETGTSGILFGDGSDIDVAQIKYDHSTTSMQFVTEASERLRIDGSGRLRLGGTFTGTFPGNDQQTFMLDGTMGLKADGDGVRFYRESNSSQVGAIVINTSSTSYNTSSDHRLKENVADMTGAIDRVKALAPKRFNFIADADTTVDGFLAHEAQAVVPEAVTGTHNEVDEDGNAVMQGIDQSKLVPLLTGALREAIAKIEDLETRLAALEGA